MQIIENAKTYDAIIVGSGAGGGMATKVFADAGLNIAVVEAGPFFDPADLNQQTQLNGPGSLQEEGRAHVSDPFFDAAYGGWDIEGEPYTHKRRYQV